MIPLTENILSSAGGWQVFKQAKVLHQMGRVVEASYEPPLLRGLVRIGRMEFKSGLKIITATNVENLCTCRESRERGRICDHSLAVGLEVLEPRPVVETPELSAISAAVVDESSLPPITGPAPRFHLSVEGSLNYLAAKLTSVRGEMRYPINTPATARHPAEIAAVKRLHGAEFMGPEDDGQFMLKGEPRVLAFLARELPRMQRDWKVEIGERFQHVTHDIERIEPSLDIKAVGENWFELSVELATKSGERFSASDIQRLLRTGQSSTRLRNLKTAVFDPGVLDEFQQALADCNPIQQQPGKYRISRAHAGYLDAIVQQQNARVQGDATWDTWTEILRRPDRLPTFPLGDLEDVLRPYQKTGVYWLKYLATNGLNGIIADEMGLGKTVQALTFLRSLKGKSIIIAPSSLLFNWAREAGKFTPERKVLVIQGTGRHKLFGEPMRKADLVVTSYPLLRRDIERYAEWEFEAAVLDEAQHIKNPDSQNAQAACSLRAKHRFMLTGTPIENSLKDLWSLMHFLMPGYLGTAQDFREKYEKAIQNDPRGGASQRLMKRMQPFVLRRLKRTVSKELPEKIEQVTFCELTDKQKTAYAELVKSTKRKLSDYDDPKDQNKARFVMLTALLRLRQACCDLRLLGLPATSSAQASGKIEMLRELLAEAIDGGHRVLIFSQFVSMLSLLREALDADGISYCYLDGSTKDRGAEVDRFQNGDVPAFLISLKAGGTGLNLTAADTVVHFDPWWNPAVEAQATDRAHRIGQEKVVTSYKLIAKGTVEEKILALQKKKKELADLALENEQPMMEALSLDEIRDLLEG